MSKIEELIQQYCPDGVEYVKLGEVAEVCRGVRVVKKQLSDSGYPVFQNCLAPMGYFDKTNCKGETTYIICAGAAGSIGYTKEDCWAADDCQYIKCSGNIINKYIYYCLLTNQNILLSKVRKASIPRLSPNVIKDLSIPIPPLEVQEEIVRILDKFSLLTAELTAELEAELELRKKQYDFYRNQLLSFDSDSDTVQWKKLGEVCEIKGRIGFRGYTKNDLVNEPEGAITLSPSNLINGRISYEKCTYISWTKYYESPEIMAEVGDVVFTKTASVGKTAYIENMPKEMTINPQLVLLKKFKGNSKYLSYILKASFFQNEVMKITGVGSVPNVSQSSLAEISIPIPPLSEQQRIVDILDRFDALVNDLSAGLPAEIEARRKQYEYYRDTLLTFKRKAE